MPHHPEPFYRPKRETWYVQIDGREHKLSKDRAEAFRLYHGLVARPAAPAARPTLVEEMLDAFLA